MQDNLKVFAVSIVVFMAIALAAGFLMRESFKLPEDGSEEIKIDIREDIIIKNSDFQLKNGEYYIYNYSAPDAQDSVVRFAIKSGRNCTAIEMLNVNNRTIVCLSRDGTDKSGSNLTFAEPRIFMFRSWMLALKEGWAWNTTIAVNFRNISIGSQNITFLVEDTTRFLNRTAYKVVMRGGGPDTLIYIDKEKRILLAQNSSLYTIILVNSSLKPQVE